MKIKIILLFVLSLLIVGCALGRPLPSSKTVTLIGNDKEHYTGRIDYPTYEYNGILTIEVGPNGEKYTGPYVIVDRTATSSTQGKIIIPAWNQLPAVGSMGSTSSGIINASGFWYATGDKGSTMECVLEAGMGGHGHGTCKNSNGREYKILF